MKFRFKEEILVEQRKQEAEKIRIKYPDRVPIIIQREPKSTIPDTEKSKFLVPNDITFGQFIWVIRRRLKLRPEQGIYFLVNNKIPQSSSTIGRMYTDDKDEDSFLYIAYGGENITG